MEASIKTGMARATGEIVIVQEDQTAVSAADLRRLWQLRLDEQLVVARIHAQPKPIDAGLLDRLSAGHCALKDMAQDRGETSGLHMIRRQAAAEIVHTPQLTANLEVAHVAPTSSAIARSDDSHKSGTNIVPSFESTCGIWC